MRTPPARAARALAVALLLMLAGTLLSPRVSAQDFQVLRVATGLARPVFLTAPPGDRERVFVVEQHTGNIRILRLHDRTLLPDPFLTVPSIRTGGEQGLLGLAFHPDYASNGYFYVNFTNPATRIVRYQVSSDPNMADAASATPVLSFSQPQSNHNGGWIGFGADGHLYIATGDGGGSNDNDPGHTSGIGNAQDITNNLLGKILRINVDGDAFPGHPGRNYTIAFYNPFVGVAGDDEIYIYGLRNPWRSSFDRETGDLYIADVGQGRCEEINVQPGTSVGGENYGWRLREGVIATPVGGGPHPPGAIDPIMDYPHSALEPCSAPGPGFRGRSITGGYVYRGPIEEFVGRYFFADFFGSGIWSLVWTVSDPALFDGTNYTDLTNHSGDPDFAPDLGSIGTISSFGEDDAGNLYIVDLGGEVFRLPEPHAMSMQLAGAVVVFALARLRRSRLVRSSASAPTAPCRARPRG